MRTKTLLIAVGALAVGAFSSMAQVESINVVGYANIPVGDTLTLISVPFKIGVSNGGNEIFGASLPDDTVFNIWNPANSTFSTAIYDTGGGFNTPPYWFAGDDVTPIPIPTFPVGAGFFITPPNPITNSFVGTVAVNISATGTNSLPSELDLVGALIPTAGSATNDTLLNLNSNLQDDTVFNIWNPANSTFTTYIYDTGGGFNTPPYWFAGDDVTAVAPPVFTVGQGFFVDPPSTFNWTQTLSP